MVFWFYVDVHVHGFGSAAGILGAEFDGPTDSLTRAFVEECRFVSRVRVVNVCQYARVELKRGLPHHTDRLVCRRQVDGAQLSQVDHGDP